MSFAELPHRSAITARTYPVFIYFYYVTKSVEVFCDRWTTSRSRAAVCESTRLH